MILTGIIQLLELAVPAFWLMVLLAIRTAMATVALTYVPAFAGTAMLVDFTILSWIQGAASTSNLPRAFTTSASSSRAWASNQFFMTSVPQAMEKVSSDTALNFRYTSLMCLCMFHCAGVWDGLGGTLKEWLRKRIVSSLAWDPHSGDPNPISTTSGQVASSDDCFQMWRIFFEVGAKGEAWRQQQRSEKKPISAMHFHWVASADIYRPDKGAVEYDCVEGISSSYQYFMLRQGGVLIRNHSCWCRACFKVAMGGPGAGRATSGLDADYGVRVLRVEKQELPVHPRRRRSGA